MRRYPVMRESASLYVPPAGPELLWVRLSEWPNGTWEISVMQCQPPTRTTEAFYGSEKDARAVLDEIYAVGRPHGTWAGYDHRKKLSPRSRW